MSHQINNETKVSKKLTIGARRKNRSLAQKRSRSVGEVEKNGGSKGCEVKGKLNVPIRKKKVSPRIGEESPEVCINDSQSTLSQNTLNGESINNQKTVIIRGSKSQSDISFSIKSRGKQCTAMAAAAIAASNILHPADWSSGYIDSLLIDGDNLYKESLATRPPVSANEVGNTEYLTPVEIAKQFEVSSRMCEFFIREEYFGDLNIDYEEAGLLNLEKRLINLLQNNVSMILTSNSVSVAIFKKDEKIWMFDSHSRNASGTQCPRGAACLLGFVDVASLLNVIKRNIPNFINERNDYMITIIEINIITQHQQTQIPLEIEESAVVNDENTNIFDADTCVSENYLFQEEDYISSLYPPPCKKMKTKTVNTEEERRLQIENRIASLRIRENSVLLESDNCEYTQESDNSLNSQESGNSLDSQTSDSSLESEEVFESEGDRYTSSSEDTDTESNFSLEFASENIEENVKNIGNYIVDIHYFSFEVQYMVREHSNKCNSLLEIVSHRNRGLHVDLTYFCKTCRFKRVLHNFSQADEKLDINESSVLGCVDSGIGFSQLEELLAAMNVKYMIKSTYSKIRDSVVIHLENLAKEVEIEAAKEEEQISVKRRDVSATGISRVAVAGDGSWMTRSYKSRVYKSKSGMAAVVGINTKKVLAHEVRNKQCGPCDYAESKGRKPKPHKCYRNHGKNRSAQSMESEIMLDLFKSSVKNRNLIYNVLIADGDSSTYNKIQEHKPYKYDDVNVRKVECESHLMRRVRNGAIRASEIKSQKQIPGVLRKSVRDCGARLTKCIRKARNYRVGEKKSWAETKENLKRDLLNIPSHIFGQHKDCATLQYFCNGVPKLNEENLVPRLEEYNMYNDIMAIMHDINKEIDSVIYGLTSNIVESFNSLIAKRIISKRVNLGKRGEYNGRIAAAVTKFNTHRVVSKYCEFRGKKTCAVVRELEVRRYKASKEQQRRKRKQRESGVAYEKQKKRKLLTDKDYGPQCQKPDLEDHIYNEEHGRLQKKLESYILEREDIMKKTTEQWKSPYYVSTRKWFLTASMFGRVCRLKDNSPSATIVKQILFPNKKLVFKSAIQFGLANEAIARAEFEKIMKVKVENSGIFIDKNIRGLAATPDGLIGDSSILEIKCPYSAKDYTPEEAHKMKKRAVTSIFTDDSMSEMKKTHAYYYQIQGQLHIAEKDKCYFMLWTPHGSKILEIMKDEKFWHEKMENQLKLFYEDCIIPEIVDSRFQRNLPLREPHYRKAQKSVNAELGNN